MHHAEFQRRGGAEDFLCAGRVLDARKLDHDAVLALLLDHRLRHAEFVYPVAQRGDVLVDREAPHFPRRLFIHGHPQRGVPVGIPLFHVQLRKFTAYGAVCRLAIRLASQGDHDPLGRTPGDRLVSDLLLTKQGPDIADIAFFRLADGAGHVDFHQEMNPAAQVQAQVHGQGTDAAQPLRRRRRKVQGDHVLASQLVAERVLGLELLIGIGESNQH